MATATLTHTPYQAIVGNNWYDDNQVNFGWCVNPADGVAKNYVSRIAFTPAESMAVSSLRLQLVLSGDSKPYGCIAYLSTVDLTTTTIQSSAATAAIATCSSKRLVNGVLEEYPSGWSSNYNNPDVYYEFSINYILQANTTYYIYLYGPNASSSNNLKVYSLQGDDTRILTAEQNQSAVNIIINNTTIQGTPYVYINGEYKQGVAYVKTSSGYKTL